MVDLGNVIGPSGIISRNVTATYTFNSVNGGVAEQKYIPIPSISGYSAFDAVAYTDKWEITVVPIGFPNNTVGINIVSAFPYASGTSITITVNATVYYKKI